MVPAEGIKKNPLMTNPMPGDDYQSACLSQLKFDEETSKKLFEWALKPHDMLILIGSPGTGKSHFCAAFINRIIAKNKVKRFDHERSAFRFFTEHSYMQYLKISMTSGAGYESEITRLCETEYFMLDDFGSSRAGEWKEGDIMYPTINARSMNRLPTIITSNLTMSEINKVYADKGRIGSRLWDKRNIIIEINSEDRRKTRSGRE